MQSAATMVSLKSSKNIPTTSNSFLTLFFLQRLFLIHVTSYVPIGHFLIDCGSSGESFATSDNRNWSGDIHSKPYSPIEQQSNQQSIAAEASELPPDKVPYATARLSRSGFTYSFPVSDGPKLLRLYFFPASYSGFDRSNSLFTVKSGQYTLVKDFDASLAVDNIENPTQTASREYCINVDSNRRLNLTFTPSTSHPNAYAFINGIEIVSIPTDLYKIDNNGYAFETLYRINVGGGEISAMQDTGMFRHWVDDGRYLKDGDSGTVAADPGLRPIYEDGGDNYRAPDQLYLTARAYGTKRSSRHNVTWEFPVDPGFAYKVRLHFCEFEQRVQHSGDRVFQIFIAHKLVEPRADVIQWSGEVLHPVYKDYAVDPLSEGNIKKLNLSIKLQSNSVSKINDIILNGIEIFKLSDSNLNLGGFEPDQPQSPPVSSSTARHSKSFKNPVVFAVAGASAFIVLFLVIFFLIYRCRRRRQAAPAPVSNKNSSVSSDRCRNFTLAEIRAATNNFDEILGHGGFGDVYKGYIDKGTKPVAIKRLKPNSEQGAHEFQTEINVLSQLRHPHLVSLIGYCDDGDEMILVYDFMSRGTLRDHLHGAVDHVLPWKQRLEICLGAAKGLQYLHEGAQQSIIHRDVKTTNILIDENWVAKVSDFGLSKLGPAGMSHTTTDVKGSYGYVDPEYCMSLRLTQKSDVYSFGVVLLDVLCGRPPILHTVEKQQYSSLVAWVRQCHHMGEIDRTVDPNLKGTVKPKCLKKFIKMALGCLHEKGRQRPSMSEVVNGLQSVLRLQESTEEGMATLTEEMTKSEERSAKLTKSMDDNDDEESGVQFTNTEASVTTDSNVMTVTTDEEQALVNYGVF